MRHPHSIKVLTSRTRERKPGYCGEATVGQCRSSGDALRTLRSHCSCVAVPSVPVSGDKEMNVSLSVCLSV